MNAKIRPGVYFDRLGVQRDCLIIETSWGDRTVVDAETDREVSDHRGAFVSDIPDE